MRELSNYIRYYNGSRRDSSLGYVFPATIESQLTAQKYENALSAETEAPQLA